MRNCPRLETNRLILRQHRRGDLPAVLGLWQEPKVLEHTIVKPSTEQEAWFRMVRAVGFWSVLGYGYWAIEEKATGLFVGELGIADFKRETQPKTGGIPEVGWALITAAHGKGYGTEALTAVVQWVRQNLHSEYEKVICLIAQENPASIRMAEKCGFRFTRYVTLKDEEVNLFELALE